MSGFLMSGLMYSGVAPDPVCPLPFSRPLHTPHHYLSTPLTDAAHPHASPTRTQHYSHALATHARNPCMRARLTPKVGDYVRGVAEQMKEGAHELADAAKATVQQVCARPPGFACVCVCVWRATWGNVCDNGVRPC